MSARDELFEPISLGPIRAKNRLMQMGTKTNLHQAGRVSPALLAFYRERAEGGIGSIIMETLSTPRAGAGTTGLFARSNLGPRTEEDIRGLRTLTDAIHDYDIPVVGQLTHGGRQHHNNSVPLLMGPSPVACSYSGGVPHELSTTDVEHLVADFAAGAASLREAGFDGVEVHAAQGHLLQSFLSRSSNRRADRYGGSWLGRFRFLEEVVTAVRAACGPGFGLGVRLAVEERVPDGIELGETIANAERLRELGIDYLSLSMGNFRTINLHIPDRATPEATYGDLFAQVRAAAGPLPVIGCGRYITPDSATAALRKGEVDVVGLCRPLISDPHWPNKAREGRDTEIRVCISCNQCWSESINNRPIRCVQNARAGREHALGPLALTPVAEPARVVVVGGGPAGLEAARVAALRGHDVVLFERDAELGGSVALAQRIPGQAEVGHVTDFLADAVTRAGVQVRTGARGEATAERILDEMPDTVVIAAGAATRVESLGAPPEFPVLTSADAIRTPDRLGARVVLFDEDGYYEAIEVAELIAERGAELTFVTCFAQAAREVPRANQMSMLGRLDELGVTVVPTTWFEGTDGRDVVIENLYSHRERRIADVDAIVHIGGKSVRDTLHHDLAGRVQTLELIGDAFMPRRIMDAVREGHDVALRIPEVPRDDDGMPLYLSTPALEETAS